MNSPAANLAAPESNQPPGGNWSGSRWFAVILLAFAAQAGFILTFGENRPPAPRTIMNVPKLRLANAADELPSLNDPTLFALPQQRDFAAAGCLKMPEVNPPSFRLTESPRWLVLSADSLGAAFGEFLQTNFFVGHRLDFKPTPELSAPGLPVETAVALNSTMQIEGELAQRQLPSQISLTNWPYADVIAPSKVQVLVDAAGNVVSTVLLPPDIGFTAADYYDAANQRALEIARGLRFTPSSSLTFGRIIFNWRTMPPPNGQIP
jgi:hypothetical protein